MNLPVLNSDMRPVIPPRRPVDFDAVAIMAFVFLCGVAIGIVAAAVAS